MNKQFKLIALSLTLGFVLAASLPAYAQGQRGGGSSGGERRGPPQEAYTACQNKSSGARCTVSTSNGSLSGTCGADKRDNSKMLCKPEGGPPQGERDGQGSRGGR